MAWRRKSSELDIITRLRLTGRTLVVHVNIIFVISVLQKLGVFLLFGFSVSFVTEEDKRKINNGSSLFMVTCHLRCLFALSAVFRLLRFEHFGKSGVTVFLWRWIVSIGVTK